MQYEIGPYRLRALLFEDNVFGGLYEASLIDDPASLVIFVHWHRVMCTDLEQEHMFRNVISSMVSQHQLELLGQDIKNSRLYSVFPHSPENIERVTALMKELEDFVKNYVRRTNEFELSQTTSTSVLSSALFASLGIAPNSVSASSDTPTVKAVPVEPLSEPTQIAPVPNSNLNVSPPESIQNSSPSSPILYDHVSQYPNVPPVVPPVSNPAQWGNVSSPSHLGMFASAPIQPGFSSPQYGYSQVSSPKKPFPRIQRRQLGIAALVLLLLCLFALGYQFLPVASAQITITPQVHRFDEEYELLMTDNPEEGELQKRTLTYQSKKLTKTGKATGNSEKPGKKATGTVTVSQVQLSKSSSSVRIQSSTGAVIIIGSINHNGGTQIVSAMAQDVGTSGNIPAYAISGLYEIYDLLTGQVYGTVYIENTEPFTGGVDAQPYRYVRASDISNLSESMQKQLFEEAKKQIDTEVKSNETKIGDVVCDYDEKSNREANDEANDFKIEMTADCTVSVYDKDATLETVRNLYKQHHTEKYGIDYVLLSELQEQGLKVQTTSSSTTFNISFEAAWVHKVDLKALTESFKGRWIWQADGDLKANQKYHEVSLVTNGFGGALPYDPAQIEVVIVEPPVPENE